MIFRAKKFILDSVRRTGHDIVKYPYPLPVDFDEEMIALNSKIKEFSMTSPERLFALCQATEYIIKAGIVGDIVECGVWRGGSMMAVAHTLIKLNDQSKNLYLFDTFEGMPHPSEKDVSYMGEKAGELMEKEDREKSDSIWCRAGIEEVKNNMYGTMYDKSKMHFIKGRVEDMIPDKAPKNIAMLRLDTDWYESTKHELEHLFPRLRGGGVLLIDDYGHWQGVKKAVDEYLRANKINLLLHRIDYTGRIAVV